MELTQNEIQELFEATLKGKNIMTPDVLKFDVVGNLIFEVSEGTDFDRDPIFGVTVLEVLENGTAKRRCDLNKLCRSLEEVEEHIESFA